MVICKGSRPIKTHVRLLCIPDRCWSVNTPCCNLLVLLQEQLSKRHLHQRDCAPDWQCWAIELHQPPSVWTPLQRLRPEWGNIPGDECHAGDHWRAARAEPVEHQRAPLPSPYPAVSPPSLVVKFQSLCRDVHSGYCTTECWQFCGLASHCCCQDVHAIQE